MIIDKKITINQPRIAILGHRGIPNSYGGFETLAEEIADRLVGFGASVKVYCRSNYFEKRPTRYKGVDLVYLPTVNYKTLDTPVHSFVSVLHVIFKNTADVVVMVNVGNAPFALLAKLFGKKVVFCVDGLDWQRKKWGKFASWYLKTCSYFAKFVSHAVVTDAQSVQEFYKNTRGTTSTHIPYGTDIETEHMPDTDVLAEYGLIYKKYFIYVARFEPENNPLLVVKAHVASGSQLPLVMIGDNRYDQEYVRQIKAAANDKVIFLGYVFGNRYKTLVKNSLAYVRAAEVGGISPAVIEAMGRSVCVIANDKPENREPIADTGLFYHLNVAAIANHFKQVSEQPEKAIELGRKAGQRAMVLYSWDTIAYEYFKVIKKVAEPKTALDGAVAAAKASTGKKRILITGAGGMLGSAMRDHFAKNYIILATSLNPRDQLVAPLDVRDQVAYEKTVADFRPDYIFHFAAQTNLEACEKNLPDTYAVNTLSVKFAAQAATKYGAKLIYVSSSNVFDGTKKYYSDNDEPNPFNVYGLTKQMGALMAEYYARDYLTIRLGWLIGGGPTKDKKFVAKIVEQVVMGKKELHALTDKSGSISYTRDVARNLEVLLEAGAAGTFNMVSSGMPTRYDVAFELVRILGFAKQIIVTPVDSNFFAQTFTAARSASECLINERLAKEHLNLQRSWESALADYLEQDFAYAFNNQDNAAFTKLSTV